MPEGRLQRTRAAYAIEHWREAFDKMMAYHGHLVLNCGCHREPTRTDGEPDIFICERHQQQAQAEVLAQG